MIVRSEYFVQVAYTFGLLSTRSWNSAEFGIAVIGPKGSHNYNDLPRSYRLLVKAWRSSEKRIDGECKMAEETAKTAEENWEAAQMGLMREHFTYLLELLTNDATINTKKLSEETKETTDGGEEEQVTDKATTSSSNFKSRTECELYMEAAWQAYRLMVYEFDRINRTKHILNSMGGLRYMMKFKKKLFEKAALAGDPKQLTYLNNDTAKGNKSSPILQRLRARLRAQKGQKDDPIFSRCRWRRMDDFLRRLDKGFPIDTQDVNGNTLLHIACQNDHLDIAQILILNGCDLNLKNNTGQTALHFAKYYDYEDIFQLLIQAGANDTILNNEGFTCYDGIHGDDDSDDEDDDV
eukprot:g1763.t1